MFIPQKYVYIFLNWVNRIWWNCSDELWAAPARPDGIMLVLNLIKSSRVQVKPTVRGNQHRAASPLISHLEIDSVTHTWQSLTTETQRRTGGKKKSSNITVTKYLWSSPWGFSPPLSHCWSHLWPQILRCTSLCPVYAPADSCLDCWERDETKEMRLRYADRDN